MKKTACLILIGIIVNTASAQPAPLKHQWHVTLKVVDESGMPIPRAKVRVAYYSKSEPASLDGLTDTNGSFEASRPAYSGLLGFTAEKTGFYSTKASYDLGFTYDSEKWNLAETLSLKKQINPIPMYAKSVNLGMPAFDKSIGYDFEIGDWVGPYGKGINADIFFTGHFDNQTNGESDYTLKVNFPNAGDGIQEFTTTILAQEGPYSKLKSSQNAPLIGYQPMWVQAESRKPGKPVETNVDAHHNYYFRVRTTLDQNGNIAKTCYGKIYGDFLRFKYFFNPMPNDRNVEFDPQKNLIKDLKPLEEVKEP